MDKPNYGIDAPGVVKVLIGGGVACVALGAVLPPFNIGDNTLRLGHMFLMGGPFMAASGLLMVLYSLVGKFKHRDRMIDMAQLKGAESVLDVGTGKGLLLIGAAKKLSTGKATGIDIWNTSDLSGNSAESTMRNAKLEGVAERVELRSDDARKMSFADGTFDVVVSNLCLHNIPDAEGRGKACEEVARVLKHGGVALIADFQKTDEYVAAFKKVGLSVDKLGPYWFSTYPPISVVKAVKSA